MRGLPPDRCFLLQGGLADPTVSQAAEQITSGLLVPLWGNHARLGILYMDNRGSGVPFREEDLYLANALASLASLQLVQERQAFLARVEWNMSRFFGPEVVRLIVEETKSGKPVLPAVMEREATVLFADLEGFSAFCRGRSPRQISELLNPYFECVAECVQRHGGHVDKFIGDGVMAVFGAQPLADGGAAGSAAASHAAQAVRAGRDATLAWPARGEVAGLRPARPAGGLHRCLARPAVAVAARAARDPGGPGHRRPRGACQLAGSPAGPQAADPADPSAGVATLIRRRPREAGPHRPVRLPGATDSRGRCASLGPAGIGTA